MASPLQTAALRNHLIRVTLLPLVVMTFWVGALIWEVNALATAARWVDHTDQVLTQLEAVDATVLQQLAAVRGYLLTASPAFRPAKFDGSVDAALDRVVALVADNPEQSRRAAEVRSRFASWRRYAQEQIGVRDSGGDYVGLVANGRGEQLVGAIRAEIDRMRAVEVSLRQQRTAHDAAIRRRLIFATTTAGLLLGVLLATAAIRELNAMARRYGTAQQQLERHAATLESEVEERTRDLQGANRQLEAFAYSISHDLRAPLRGMQGLSEALLEDYGDRLDDSGRGYARRIASEAALMDALIQDLLTYSRLSRAELTREAVDLNEVVESAIVAVRDDIDRRGASVRVDDGLPMVHGHRAILVQVFVNLLSNALKFSAAVPTVVVRCTERDRIVRVSVEDNGIGIAREHWDRIFNVFERLHGSEAYPGTGIGLAIVRRGIERLGGRVGVESTPGRGSCFWIELPRAVPRTARIHRFERRADADQGRDEQTGARHATGRS